MITILVLFIFGLIIYDIVDHIIKIIKLEADYQVDREMKANVKS